MFVELIPVARGRLCTGMHFYFCFQELHTYIHTYHFKEKKKKLIQLRLR